MIEKKKDLTHITLTVFYIVYSFSALEHHSQHFIFTNMFFIMFVAGCIMIGKHLNYKYVSIIPFMALPIVTSVFFNALYNYRGHLMGSLFKSYGSVWEHGLPPYLALAVLLFNCFLLVTVFTLEPLNYIRRFLKGVVDFWQAEDVEFEFEKKTNKEKNNEQR